MQASKPVTDRLAVSVASKEASNRSQISESHRRGMFFNNDALLVTIWSNSLSSTGPMFPCPGCGGAGTCKGGAATWGAGTGGAFGGGASDSESLLSWSPLGAMEFIIMLAAMGFIIMAMGFIPAIGFIARFCRLLEWRPMSHKLQGKQLKQVPRSNDDMACDLSIADKVKNSASKWTWANVAHMNHMKTCFPL